MNRFTSAVLIVSALLCGAAPAAHASGLTVYSSLPRSGPARAQTLAIERGARLALKDAGGTAGGKPVGYVPLDDGTHRAGSWTPQQAQRAGKRAARDASTIGFIGDFNSGASAITIPILNQAGIAQISPTSTYIGLTKDGPGTAPGEPAKFYPHPATRTFFRLMPDDTVQGSALAAAMQQHGCTKVAAVNDDERYGKGVGVYVRNAAPAHGLSMVATATIHRARSYRALARKLAKTGAQCVVYTGITANGAVRLFTDVGHALPHAQLFGSDGIAESAFADPHDGGVPAAVGKRVLVTVSVLAPEGFPAAGQQLLARYGSVYHDKYPDVDALYGYESMRLLLDAVNAAGPDRAAVVGWLHGVQNRASVLGTYGFDAGGDSTLRSFGVYRVTKGSLGYVGAVVG